MVIVGRLPVVDDAMYGRTVYMTICGFKNWTPDIKLIWSRATYIDIEVL